MKRVLLLALLLPMGAMADPIFDINRTIGPGSVVGTMTTDGTIGVLSAANFTAWNLTLYDGTDSIVLSQANSRIRIGGDGLSATASDLLFDFGTAGPLRLFIVQGPGDQNGDPVWCVFGAFACWNGGITSGEGVAARNINTGGAIISAGRGAGKTTIGTAAPVAVPEPGTLALLCIGLAAVSRRCLH